jgi:hypothetical protein
MPEVSRRNERQQLSGRWVEDAVLDLRNYWPWFSWPDLDRGTDAHRTALGSE